MITSIKLSILVFALLFNQSLTYKPVVLIHGIMTGSGSMELIKNRIEEVIYKLSHSSHIYESMLFCYITTCKRNKNNILKIKKIIKKNHQVNYEKKALIYIILFENILFK